MAEILRTYSEFSGTDQKGGSIREDLQDFVANLSPQDTPLLSGLTQVQVNAGLVEWLEDSLAPSGHNANIEALAFTNTGITAPVRRAALVQHFYKGGTVSDRERLVAHAGTGDPMLYYEMKALKELKNDIEHALHRGSAVSGTVSTAPQFAGLLNVLTVTNASGITLTETHFNDLLQVMYNAGDVQPAEVYCGPTLKRRISSFTSRNTVQIAATDRRMINSTAVYESDFGVSWLLISRNQIDSPGVRSLVVIDPRYFLTGWLKNVTREQLPRDGTRDRFQLSAELTLIYKSSSAGIGIRCE